MSWPDDLVTLMTDNGMVFGTDVFVGTRVSPPILDSGEATLVIVETSASAPERTQNSVAVPAYINVAAQFMARATSPAKARAKAQAAYSIVVGVRNSWIVDTGMTASGWYREIVPLQEPFDVGVDERGQSQYGFNVIAVKRGG